MKEMTAAYVGREQTWLKHRVPHGYLDAWAHKLASKFEHLWYVDCFAGPWNSGDEDLDDTSVAIGLRALNEAAKSWAGMGRKITLHAIFVEQDAKAFATLQTFVRSVGGDVDVQTRHGTFGEIVQEIGYLIGQDPAFIFIDPKGWKGIDLEYVALLAAKPRRDVMINVMYEHVNRFKDDNRPFLRDQIRSLFGLKDGDLPPALTEAQLMALYRSRLATQARVRWVADLAVPVPTKERTYFRLVVAGHHERAVELFRDVEAKVIGSDAATVRANAKRRAEEDRTGQPTLLAEAPPKTDERYAALHGSAEAELRRLVPLKLARDGPQRFGELWPKILCGYHLRLADLKRLVGQLRADGLFVIEGMTPRERVVKDGHTLRLAATPSGVDPA